MRKTKFLFDTPVTKDWMFYVFLVFLASNIVNGLQNVNSSGGLSTSQFGIVSGLIDGAFRVILSWFPIIPIIYFIRKVVRKRRNEDLRDIEAGSELSEKNNSEQFEVSNSGKKSRKRIIFIGVGILIIGSAIISTDNTDSESNKYFQVEQLISAQVKEWNIAATPISQVVSGISNGTVGEMEARRVAGEASSNFAVIHNNLRDACMNIPNYDVNASGKDGAIALSYDALQVTCDLLPQESIEILALVAAQLSLTSTQSDLDYHSNQIASLIERRKAAISKSIDALEPFATQAERDQLARLKVMLNG